jgi:ketosteroid isomerase-like protein
MTRLIQVMLALSAASGALAQERADGAAARAIRAARERSNAAIAAHDTAGIGAILAPDVVIVTSASAIQMNRAASLRGFAEQFRTRPGVSYRRSPERIEVFALWRMASEEGQWTGGWRDADGPVSLGGRYFAKWRERDGRWLIESETYVPDRCVGGAYCRSLLPGGTIDRLPHPISNTAVAAGRVGSDWWSVSLLGIDSTRTALGVRSSASLWTSSSAQWRSLPPVPGEVGRLAASAQIVRGRVLLFGGYTVDTLTGAERSVPRVDLFDPATSQWRSGAPMPVPIDDAVTGVYRDSLVYVVSGWSDTNSVSTVQLYDVLHDRWHTGTPFPGTLVFGHAGAIAGNTIVVIDGAARQSGRVRYRPVRQTWIGIIDSIDATRIRWERGPSRAGPSLYRAAAAPCADAVIIAGGTDNPYNYNGIGYDGRVSRPLAEWWRFETRARRWMRLDADSIATMDHRALAIVRDEAWLVGGMRDGPVVTDAVRRRRVGPC